MSQQDYMTKDYYKVLGLTKDASKADIDKAYRKLARDLHPDKNKGDQKAADRFKEVGEAYAVLNNPKEKAEYDKIRAYASGGPRFQSGPSGMGGGSFGGFDINDLFGGGAQSGQSFDFSDLFGGGFGGGSPFGGRQSSRQSQRGQQQEQFDINEFLRQQQNQPSPQPAKPKNPELKVKLGYSELVLGTQIKVTTPWGAKKVIKIPPLTEPGKKLKIKNDSGDSKYQDLILIINLAMPQKVTPQMKEILEKYKVIEKEEIGSKRSTK